MANTMAYAMMHAANALGIYQVIWYQKAFVRGVNNVLIIEGICTW